MSALNRISMAIAGLFGTGSAATPLANRNFIVDGAIEFTNGSSTALTPASGTPYTCNLMWLGNCGTGGAATINNQQARTNGLGGDSGANGLYAHSQTTASTGSFATGDLPVMQGRVEFVNKLAGKSVTLSAKIMVAAGSMTIPGIQCRQFMGTGGSPSAGTTLDKAVTWNITTTLKKFSVRLDLPSVSGLTLGTNNNDLSIFGIYFPAGWTGTVYVTEVQVELCSPRASSDLTGNGGLATCFEYRGYGPELARVQRYYTGTPYASGINSYADVATRSITQMEFRFPVTMRAVPAISITNANLVNVTIGSIFSSTNGFNQGATAVAAGFSSYTYTVNACDARL